MYGVSIFYQLLITILKWIIKIIRYSHVNARRAHERIFRVALHDGSVVTIAPDGGAINKSE